MGYKSGVTTYGYSADVVQVIHAKHLLVWILDNAEIAGGVLLDELAAIQPLTAGVREAKPGKVPETRSFAARTSLDPARSLGKRDV